MVMGEPVLRLHLLQPHAWNPGCGSLSPCRSLPSQPSSGQRWWNVVVSSLSSCALVPAGLPRAHHPRLTRLLWGVQDMPVRLSAGPARSVQEPHFGPAAFLLPLPEAQGDFSLILTHCENLPER